jgi:CDGSH-type Zn-finger protein
MTTPTPPVVPSTPSTPPSPAAPTTAPVAPPVTSSQSRLGAYIDRYIGQTNPKLDMRLPPKSAQYQPYPVMVEAGKTYYWCACGHSAKQPFCDGTHHRHPPHSPNHRASLKCFMPT